MTTQQERWLIRILLIALTGFVLAVVVLNDSHSYTETQTPDIGPWVEYMPWPGMTQSHVGECAEDIGTSEVISQLADRNTYDAPALGNPYWIPESAINCLDAHPGNRQN